MTLIDVSMDDGRIMLARIVDSYDEGFYNVKFLNPTRNMDYFRFDKKVTRIQKECVSGFYESDDVTVAGYAEEIDELYSKIDSDEGSVASDRDSDTDSNDDDD